MGKYKVLFTGDSGDATDDSVKVGADMYFGYREQWTFDTFAGAWNIALDNNYSPREFIVVKVVEYDVIETQGKL